MKPYELLKKRPLAFKNLAGVGVNEFTQLYRDLLPLWADGEHKRLSRADRQRAIGGGHPYTLELEAQLLMTLLWLHLRLNTNALSFLFGVDKATVSRNTRRVLKSLAQLDGPALAWPQRPQRGHGKSLEQACRDYPDLLTLVQITKPAGPSSSTSNPYLPLPGQQLEGRFSYGLSGP